MFKRGTFQRFFDKALARPAAWLYARRARRITRMPTVWMGLFAALLLAGFTGPAGAASCAPATSAGTAPADWATYCWLDFSTYDDALARAGGQSFVFNLPDGSTLSFVATVNPASTSTLKGVTAPSWTGAAVGNTAFLGIPGRPILYTATAGTITITFFVDHAGAAPGGHRRRHLFIRRRGR